MPPPRARERRAAAKAELERHVEHAVAALQHLPRAPHADRGQ